MFRALERTLTECEGFVDHSAFVQNQTRTFTQQYPNAFPTTLDTTDTKKPRDSLMNSLAGLVAYDPNTRQANTNGRQLQNYVVSMDVNQDLIRRANECKTTSLDSLMGSVNLNDTVRCGWIYAKGSPGDTPLSLRADLVHAKALYPSFQTLLVVGSGVLMMLNKLLKVTSVPLLLTVNKLVQIVSRDVLTARLEAWAFL